MATRIYFESQLNHVDWLETDGGIVTAVSDPNLGNHLLGLRIEGAVSAKQQLQFVTPDGAKHTALPSPIKQLVKK